MVRIPMLCPHCHSDQVIEGGKTKTGTQRSKCANPDGPHETFQRAHVPRALACDQKTLSQIIF